MPDGVDPHGGLWYSRYERTRIEKTWKETLAKESDVSDYARKFNGPPTYVMNMANNYATGGLLSINHSHSRLEIIADKVQTSSPQEKMSAENLNGDSFELRAMRHREAVPAKKWDLPHTRSQEIGWLISQPVRADDIRGRRNYKRYHPRPLQNALKTGELPTLADVTTTLSASSSAPCFNTAQPGGPRMSPHMPEQAPAPEMSTLNVPRWRKPRVQCPITQYADIFVAQMHCNPFNQVAAGR